MNYREATSNLPHNDQPDGERVATQKTAARIIAFYLPQFHPIAENNLWWGEGFTEWNNVVKARPLFPGHYQPHLPADLGFYDLRLPEARHEQADLAREYGINGFCYYHYWFNGKRLLERPVDEIIASGEPNFPFCLCWANETWSRRWTGEEREILQRQDYGGDADDRAHIRQLLKALSDPRAITIEGKPIFLVYRARSLPNPLRSTDIWREEAHKAGLAGLYLISVSVDVDGYLPQTIGFDAIANFQPNWNLLYNLDNSLNRLTYKSRVNPKWALRSASNKYEAFRRPPDHTQLFSNLQVVEYRRAVEVLSAVLGNHYNHTWFPCVCPRWDNTPRRGSKGLVLVDDDPEEFKQWLQKAVDYVASSPRSEQIVFINAWNEWAEGNHLEPDLKHGLRYLEAVKEVVSSGRGQDGNRRS